MKKKMIILILLICFCCSGLFANDFWGFNNRTGSLIMDGLTMAVGLGWILIPSIDSDLNEPPYNTILYCLGGGFMIFGFIGLMYDIIVDDSGYAKAIEEDPILKHVSFGTNGKDSYLGARFSF
jgi:hypothetical protein